jgi:2-dehydropantoate 2-reductase
MNSQAVERPYRVLVMGAGAMGSAVGGFLAKAGHAVTLVGRDPHIGALREHGLRITGIWGDHLVTALKAQTDLSGLRRGDFDLILIAVKSYDTATAAASIRRLVDEDTLVCSYQNGLGNAEQIAEVVGWKHTVGARVIYGVRLTEPGCAEITVIANPTALGIYDPETPVGRVRDFAAAMDAAGIPTVYTDEIATLLWGKVAYNCALNPLSALLDVPYGVLAESEHALATMREVITELYAVARAMNVRLDPDMAEAYMDLLVGALIPPTAAHYASMREDFCQRRRTEIDALNGAICRYGRQYNVPCPTNTVLTRLVRAREHALGVDLRAP